MDARESTALDAVAHHCGAAAVVAPDDAAGRVISLRGEVLPPLPLLRPATTDELSFVVRQAAAAGCALIPLGGASGLVGGQRPLGGREWVLSLERMNAIEEIDVTSRVAVVQAGVVLQTLQQAAEAQGLLFAVDLGARGSATVGGLVATNAGGERVLRFGMMREQVLGLEVVLADGTVLDLMDRVLKNNAGYDLKQLFVGSEGTLGIVTRAVLRLRPAFAGHEAAFLALPSLDDLPALLNRLQAGLGGTLSACEVMWPEFIATMAGDGAPHRCPVAAPAGGAAAYLLVEVEGGDPLADRERLEAVLVTAIDDGLVGDAALAKSLAERNAFWALRNDIPQLVRVWSPMVAFDVSVPLPTMAGYVDELRAALAARWPAARLLVFGHVADDNLHVIVTIGADTPARHAAIGEVVYAGVCARRGSISAEHGIGIDKRAALAAHRPPEVLALMRQLKGWLDPQGRFNPGKVV